MKKLNVPNTLSLIRVALVPVFMAAILLVGVPEGRTFWPTLGLSLIPVALFALTAFTDMLDGKIARKYNLITDFGKFIDPLADKFMTFGALIAILVVRDDIAPLFVWVAAIIMLRELTVTSLRLVVAGSSGKVVAASMAGKIKTVSQCVSIVLILIEPAYFALLDTTLPILSYIGMAAMTVTTVWSGLDYLKAYLPMIDPSK